MAFDGLNSTVRAAFSFSDRYEKKTRLLPGAFVVLPLAIASYVAAATQVQVWTSVGLSALTEMLLIVLVGLAARHLGVVFERRLFKGLLPTDLWLSVDSPKSKQQLAQWADALEQVTGLDIRRGSKRERAKVVRDATAQARKRLRDNPLSVRTQEYNEDYGLARNLGGLVPVWLVAAAIGALVCLMLKAWFPLAVELAFLVGAVGFYFAAPTYVRWAADRYAESFLSTVVVVAESEGGTVNEPAS